MLFPEVRLVQSYWDYMKMSLLPVKSWCELRLCSFPYYVKKARIFRLRGESLIEHQAKTTFLAKMFLDLFPGFFPEDLEGKELLDAITFLLIKNAGQIETGNLCRDGRKITKTKLQKVWSRFASFVNLAFEKPSAENYSKMYQKFENTDSHLGMALATLDMLEHVMTLAFLEDMGMSASIQDKPIQTDRTKHFIKKCDTYNALDIFAADMLKRIRHYPDSIKKPVHYVLREAVTLCRGEFFPWWSDFEEK